MSRFLITTSDERTWEKGEKILFLGEWCKKLNQKEAWSQMDYKVLAYHWDDQNQMLSDYQYLKEIYEKYLKILSQSMNNIHNTNHSLKYWRIVIGPWLQLFIGIVFDKWKSIKEAIKEETITSTKLLDMSYQEMIPHGMRDMQEFFYSDLWHHKIYSQIIIANKQIPYKKVEYHPSHDNSILRKTPSRNFKSFAKKVVRGICGLIPDKFNKVVFLCNNFSKLDLIRLQISLGQIPYLVDSKIELKEIPIRPNMRKGLEMLQASNEFEKVLEKLIPANIPILNVELYSKLFELVLDKFPKKLSAIVTTHGYWAEDEVKLWAAEKMEKGAKLIIGQHGGLFGSGLIEQSEEHQIQISDRFYTWGWGNEKHSNVQPLPSPKLSSVKNKKICPKKDGPILWVWGANFPKNYYRMYSVPIASQCLKYVHDQIEFGKNISKEASQFLKLRLKPNRSFFWEEDQYLKNSGLDKIIESGNKDLYQRLNESRLCITTDNSTVFLETLAINFPTILFWNPKHWQLRSGAQPFYDELRQMKILHDSPTSAATMVNEIYNNPLDWWFQTERQRVIKSFCKEFACVRPDWLVEWKNELKALSSVR